ncbi:MAG: RNA polymerase sigma factor, partial [Chloroflexota bacterium]
MQSTEIDALAARARGGDRQALGELYAVVQPVLAPVLRQYARRGEEGPLEPSDLAQQSFLILAEVVASWQRQGPFVAWLRRLFPLELLGYRRACLHWDGPAVESLPYEELTELLETHAELATVPDPFDAVLCRQMLALLPLSYRRLLVWRFGDGLSYRDVERLYGVPAATAQAQCQRALAYLRAWAEGREAAPLETGRAARSRKRTDIGGVIVRLWAMAERNDGLLPSAPAAVAALGLGRRAYDSLIARLTAGGCLSHAEGV